MQGEPTGLAGEPSGQGEVSPPEGLGGHHRLAQTDARRPACEVVSHHPVSSTGQALYGQPGGVGGKASRGQVVEPLAVLEIADDVLDLGVAAMVSLQVQGVTLTIGDEGVMAVIGKQGELGATLCPYPGCAEVTN